MKVAILGYGVEGKSAASYWQAQGAEITICDNNTDLAAPAGVPTRLGPDYLANLDDFDLIVRGSPAIRPDSIKTTKPVTSVTSEFLSKSPAKVIGVTGTKGKGTTSSLIAKILEAAGHKVWLGGNIGVAALDFLNQVKPEDYVVLELSSFQLMDVTQSPQIAVMLMLAADHLNYHVNLEEYHQAKANIFRFQKPEDVAVYNALDPKTSELVKLSAGRHIPYGTPEGGHVKGGAVWFGPNRICPVATVGLIGAHNLENVCGAVAATWDIVQDPAPMIKAISEFKGLPHRLELVGKVRSVRYFDDSIATVPENSIAAIKAFDAPKVIILGGSDKGATFDELAQVVKQNNVVSAIVTGQTAGQITAALDKVGFHNYQTGASGMGEMVEMAAKAAPSGGVVLLSPGCASFGDFAGYADRGDQFRAAVAQLAP